jgi:hypothetical protein
LGIAQKAVIAAVKDARNKYLMIKNNWNKSIYGIYSY